MRILVSLVSATGRMREPDRKAVLALAGSMAEIGLINPITVTPATVTRDGQPVEGYRLVAGANRLAAARHLGWAEIEATVIEMTALARQMAEIDENLIRAELTPAERADWTARRKSLYEEMHPETRHGANQHTRSRKVCDSSDDARFTAETAARTGRSERAVQLDARRGAKIAPEVMERVRAEPALNTGTVLDALARTPRAEQPARLAEIAAAKNKPKPVPRADADTAKAEWMNAVRRLWNRAADQWRGEMLEELLAAETPPVHQKERSR